MISPAVPAVEISRRANLRIGKHINSIVSTLMPSGPENGAAALFASTEGMIRRGKSQNISSFQVSDVDGAAAIDSDS